MFSMQSVSQSPSKATFQLSSAASLNLGRSQNGVLENRLTTEQTAASLTKWLGFNFILESYAVWKE